MEAMRSGTSAHFWDGATPLARPERKRKPTIRRLVRTFSRIARIEPAGSEMTYDLAVTGPYHNFVANGFIVHNSVNEYSGRYSVMPDEFYAPQAEHVTSQSKTNRQGGADCLDPAECAEVLRILTKEQRQVRAGYDRMIELDVRRELARINLGVSQYTEWYWKNDLHNIFHFLQLRLDPHAQHEIRVYAEAMAQIVRAVAPIAWEAFEDYQLGAERFSRLELETLARLLGDAWPDAKRVEGAFPEAWREANAKGELKRNRERDEFLAKLGRLAERRKR
jgi:thymidylate synthase ThyX